MAGLIGWFTARTTTQNQLKGMSLSVEEDREKRLDDKVEFVMSELRKEIERLEKNIGALQTENRQQAESIKQQNETITRMRRVLETHGLEVPN